MLKKLIGSFLKDKIIIISIYIINSVLIIFFNLLQDKSNEIIYPTIISLFLLVVLLGWEWDKYYNFNKYLYKYLEENNTELKIYYSEHKRIHNILENMKNKHMNEIYEMEISNNKHKKFISQWIHNLKSPLSVIKLVSEKSILEDFKNLKNILKFESKILENSIDGVLNILRLDNFDKDYEPKTFNLVSILKDIINNNKNSFIYNKVYPKLEYENDEINIITDIKWHNIIINQIISNGIKYSFTKENKKNIYFKIKKEGKNVRLFIIDEGMGIPEYDIQRVFEPFFTGENGRKIGSSTGIGLYICKEISEKIGLELSISSSIQSGTEVKIAYLTKV
ncbi:MAG: ATP-binding protein [Clostridiales bacterium]